MNFRVLFQTLNVMDKIPILKVENSYVVKICSNLVFRAKFVTTLLHSCHLTNFSTRVSSKYTSYKILVVHYQIRGKIRLKIGFCAKKPLKFYLQRKRESEK